MHLTIRQTLVISLLSAVMAAGLVIGYDRWAERPAQSEQPPPATTTTAPSSPPATTSAGTEDERNNIDVYRAVSPGVVNISTKTLVRDFFSIYEQEGGGTGSIIDAQGHIVTNYHVIEGARELTVSLADGSQFPARIVGGDSDTDLAVIKIDATKLKLTVVKLGDSSQLVVGQKVLAIGNPFGLQQTLTEGIISALERPIRARNQRLIEGAIQTDASINPGNSGGPLLNSRGEMIGINSQIITPSEGSVGIGFAIPVNLAKRIIPDLIARGRAFRPWLGVEFLPIPVSQLADRFDLAVDHGQMVSRVFRGHSADRAGIEGGTTEVRAGRGLYYFGGDIIVTLDGEKISSVDDVNRVMNRHRPGDVVSVEVVREGRRRTLSMPLTEKPAGQ